MKRSPLRRLRRALDITVRDAAVADATIIAQQQTIRAQKREIDRLRSILKGHRKP